MPKLKKAKRDPSIQYQNNPNGSERCGLCTMFRRPNECTAVAGTISVVGWCKIFSPRKER